MINGLRIADRFPDQWARSHDALIAPLRAATAESGGDPERDAPAIFHLAFGTMEDALVRRIRPSDADVEYVVECSVAIIERRSDMDRKRPA